MARSEISKLRYMEIDGDSDGIAFYSAIIEFELPERTDIDNLTLDLASGEKLPASGERVSRSDLAALAERPPESRLNVDMGDRSGAHMFAFRLLPEWRNQLGLQFVDGRKPFARLPIHHPQTDFLTRFRCLNTTGENERRVATFTCNLDAVRESKLADKIRELALDEKGLLHSTPVMKIPFALNVVDPKLKFAPWVIPSDDEAPGLLADKDIKLPVLTHGGVHPRLATFLTLYL